ncbi:MAG: geranylgeranylglyceryl/heptaprenylglyceryl phosphate synthase [Bacteroidales bacterium]
MNLLRHLEDNAAAGKKQLAILIDPDKCHPKGIKELAMIATETKTDYFFVGGSLLTRDNMDECIAQIRKHCNIPVLLFPGSMLQVTDQADAILLLSLISGRNADMLIGNHVVAAPLIRHSKLEVIPTGYMLIESGKITSVLYMSNTIPIPFDKVDIGVCTAMAGEMLGLRTIYMDAGSGAIYPIPTEMIRAVKQNISVPLIIGGGVRTAEDAAEIWEGGADVITVGNAAETHPEIIHEIAAAKHAINQRINSNSIVQEP